MDGTLMQNNLQTQIQDRMSNHGKQMAKVMMQPGWDCYAKTGSMVAYEGLLDILPDPPSLRERFKAFRTGEKLHLMQVQGQGILYLADYGNNVIILQLSNEAISLNAKNVLAFDANLEWKIERQEGITMLSGGGMYNVVIRGNGWCALTTKGTPIMLDTREAPTFVDTDALVAYTVGLKVQSRRTARFGALVGRDTGEAFQLGFQGQGFVIVQPSEDDRPLFSFRG